MIRYLTKPEIVIYRRDGLVGYDAALTRLRSGVRLPLLVIFLEYQYFCLFGLRMVVLQSPVVDAVPGCAIFVLMCC